MAVEKITKRILDPSLLGEIENKATKEELQEYRKKSVPINEDDLTAALRTKVNSGGGSGGTGAYDDSDLRTRIQTLETDKAEKTALNAYFKKDTDKVSLTMLETNLKNTIDNKANASDLNLKIDAATVAYLYRAKATNIAESDLTNELRTKINSGTSAGTVPSSLLQDIEDIKDVNTAQNIAIENLQNNSDNYRRKDVPIVEADLNTAIADKINHARQDTIKINESDLASDILDKLVNINASIPANILQDIADIRDVNTIQEASIQNIQNNLVYFRKHNVLINETDLETALKNKINQARQTTVKITESDLAPDILNRLANTNLNQNSLAGKIYELESKLFYGPNGSILSASSDSLNKTFYDWLAKLGNYFYTDNEINYARNCGITEYYDLKQKHYYILDNGNWVLENNNILENTDIVNRLLFNPILSTVYLITGNGDVFTVSNNNKVYEQKVEINANGNLVINLIDIFGAGITATDVNISVKVKDNVVGSRTNGKWINSEAVATVAIEASSPTIQGQKITIFNDANERLEFLIILSALKLG